MKQDDVRETQFEKDLIALIRKTYSDKVWLPIPEEYRAKDAVAADLLRSMAPAMAGLALEVFVSHSTSLLQKMEGLRISKKTIDKNDKVLSVSQRIDIWNAALSDCIAMIKKEGGI